LAEFRQRRGFEEDDHGPLSHLVMGSVAEGVVRIAPCPVLTVRDPEHDFVVPDTVTGVREAEVR